MKADDSSTSRLNIRIPKFQQLSSLEPPVSGSWLQSNHYLTESTTKFSSPPMSITPPSMCTDLSDREYPIVNLLTTSSRKCSFSSPPLSNIKSESIDSMEISSSMISSPSDKKSTNVSKPIKQCSNFSIDYLLSNRSRTSNLTHSSIHSIFSKKKRLSFTDRYLHRRISPRQPNVLKKSISSSQYSIRPRRLFLRYMFDFFNDLISRHYHIKTQSENEVIDPLAQLAELACKLDTRERNSILHEEIFSLTTFDCLLKQSYRLIEQIDQKCEHKKHRKRLNHSLKFKSKERFLHLAISILNRLQMKKHHQFDQSRSTDCQILMSDIPIERTKMKSMCFYLKPTEITANLEILLPNKGLLYEGVIQPIQNYDDLLLVRLNHERQMYLIPIHDLCRLACPKMIPEDFSVLSKGLRVCAYWSTSLRGLHPATVKKIPVDTDESSMVGLVFDDGDSGLIKLDEIRLLPDNYNVQSLLQNLNEEKTFFSPPNRLVLDVDLEEWRVSSSQIPSSLPTASTTTRRTSRRSSSLTSQTSHSPLKRIVKKEKPSPIVPQWTLNLRNSTVIRHDKKQTLHVGDCVILHGAEHSLSYIGKVLKFYQNKSTKEDLVRLKWYYSPEETPIGRQEDDLPGALYESTHIDENALSTLRYKGTIYASFDDYMKKTDGGRKRKEHDYYLVGHYNPTTGKLQRYKTK